MKNKLFLIGLATLVMLGLGGYYFFQFDTVSYPEYDYNYNQDNHMMSAPDSKIKNLLGVKAKGFSGNKKGHRRSQNKLKNESSSIFNSGNSFFSGAGSKRVSRQDLGVDGQFKRLKKERNRQNNAPAYAENLFLGGSKASRSNEGGRSSSTMGITSPIVITPPSSVAYFSGSNYAAVDPGFDPEEDTRIPVGEGSWILILLALAYGIRMKFKANS